MGVKFVSILDVTTLSLSQPFTFLYRCGNRSWAETVPRCYGEEEEEGEVGQGLATRAPTGAATQEWGDWTGVSLSDFMACPSNLAVNRQTRMLADLELVDCYNSSSMALEKREAIMLASAKTNLERMAYFGLTEQQRISQYLFEETFNLRFKENFEQLEGAETHSGSTQEKLKPEVNALLQLIPLILALSPVICLQHRLMFQVLARIEELNHLDAELHRFASKLLLDRFKSMSDSDSHFSEHMERLGQEKYKFSWKDIEDENYDDESQESSQLMTSEKGPKQ